MNQASTFANEASQPSPDLDSILKLLEVNPEQAIREFTSPDGPRQALVKELVDRLCAMHREQKGRASDALASLEDRLLWKGHLARELFQAYLDAGLGDCVARVFEQAEPGVQADLARALADKLAESATKGGAEGDKWFDSLARAWEQVGDLYDPAKAGERRRVIQWHLDYGCDFPDRLAGLKDRVQLRDGDLIEAVFDRPQAAPSALARLRDRLRLNDRDTLQIVVLLGRDVAERLVSLKDPLRLRDEDLIAAVVSGGGPCGQRLTDLKRSLRVNDLQFLESIRACAKAAPHDLRLSPEQRKDALKALDEWLLPMALIDASPEAKLRDQVRGEVVETIAQLERREKENGVRSNS